MPRVAHLSRWLIAAGPLTLLLGLAPGPAPAQALTLHPPTGILHTTYGPPSIDMVGSSEAVTAGDNHGNIDAWQTNSVGGSWEFIRIATAGGGLLYSSPVLAWTGSSTVFASIDSGGGLDFWSRAPDTGAWTRQQVAAGGYSSPALTVGNGSVMLTAQHLLGSRLASRAGRGRRVRDPDHGRERFRDHPRLGEPVPD